MKPVHPSDPRHATHVLIDGIRMPQALERFARHPGAGEIELLYQMSRFKELAEHGPILIELRGAALLDPILAPDDDEWCRGATLLASRASSEALADHLRQFIDYESAGQPRRLLRFADPLVTRHWFESFGDTLPAELLGPVATWWVPYRAPRWAPQTPARWVAHCHPLEPHQVPDYTMVLDETQKVALFGLAQRRAFQEVGRWQFKEALTEHLCEEPAWQAIAPGQRGPWLDTRLDEAQAWGISSQRHAALWMELALAWGDDFISRECGPYAQWRRQHDAPESLGREQRLEALEAWREAYEPEADSLSAQSTGKPTVTQDTM